MLPSIFNSKNATTALALGFATLLAAACSHTPPHVQGSSSSAIPSDRQISAEDPYPVRSVTIQIEQIETKQIQKDEWQVSYQTDVAVNRLFFEFSLDRARVGHWTPVDPNFAIDVQGVKQYIHRKDGQPFQTSSFRFGTDSEPLKEGYSFSIPFKDGSSAFYSSYFWIHGSQQPATHFDLVPIKGQYVVVNGSASNEPLTWEGPAGPSEYGAYLYFGKIKPSEHAQYVDLLDPGLPKWIKRYVGKSLPWILSKQESRLGALTFGKPFIIINQWPKAQELHRFSGGAADHWLQLGLSGADWKRETALGREKLFYFMAHELSHFWTSQKRVDFERLGWINEGGANYFANELALEYHLITQKEHDHRQALAAQSCKEAISAHPDVIISQNGFKTDVRLGYECGHLIHFTLARILHQENPSRDLFSFWGALLRRAHVSNGGLFSESDYFTLAHAWIHSPELSQELRDLEQFVTEPAHAESFLNRTHASINSGNSMNSINLSEE